jgi:hypothetical protein
MVLLRGDVWQLWQLWQIFENATVRRAISYGSAEQFQNFTCTFSEFQNPRWAISIRLTISDQKKLPQGKKTF